MFRNLWFTVFAAAWLIGCSENNPSYPASYPEVPAHLPAMPFPADNPITPDKVELGRHLFYDKRLSLDSSISCESCHQQAFAFTNAPRQVSTGVGGAMGQRNSPTVVNSGYRRELFWDGRASSLEEQAMGAFLNSVEMAADTFAVARLLRSDFYRPKWIRAFGDTTVTMWRAMQAISTFERTIVSGKSRYDQYVNGNKNALSEVEKKGLQLFFSNKTMCGNCHGGPDLTDDEYYSVGLFHHYFDRGRYNVTNDPYDEGKFRTPTLRNVDLTPPYMATGDNEKQLLNTLAEVVDHYNDGGTSFINKDKRVKKLNLTQSEKDALVAFMKALTDSSILLDQRFSAPR